MPLNAINISVSEKGLASYVSDILFEMGALSVNLTDLYAGTPSERPFFTEPPQHDKRLPTVLEQWQGARITGLYPLETNMQDLIMLIATHFDLPETPSFSIQTETFDEKTPDEWVRHVQESFQPIELGRVRISFPWHERHPDFIDICLEPGLAFGTGEHTTTQLCLGWLQRVVKPGFDVLDFGTGSGVLAIASAMLAANVSAVGIDISPEAVTSAKDNAITNNVEHCTQFFENHDEPVGKTYDIVIANILARPLKQLAPLLSARLKSGALIGLTGLLTFQAPQLIELYAQYGISLCDAEVQSEWALLVGLKS